MYDWLLFLHVLAAFALVAGLVILTAVTLRAPVPASAVSVADGLWGVGGIGTLVLGVWLAIDVDGYEVWDGWILGAIVLWVVAAAAATLGRRPARERYGAEGGATATARSPAWHWVAAAATLLLLADMIWKPGA